MIVLWLLLGRAIYINVLCQKTFKQECPLPFYPMRSASKALSSGSGEVDSILASPPTHSVILCSPFWARFLNFKMKGAAWLI